MRKDLSRRQFMKRAAVLGGGVALSGPIASILAACGGAPAAPAQPAAPQPAAPAQAAPSGSAMTAQAPAQPQAAAPALEPAPAAAAASAMTEKKVTGPVRWMSWSAYDFPEIKKSFEEKYGVTVQLSAFGPNAEAFGKIKASGTGAYDTIGADGGWPLEYYRNGFIEAFDMAEFNSAPELLPEFRTYALWLVEGNKMLSFPSAASPSIVWYNEAKVKPAPTGFEVLFDPQYKNKVILSSNLENNILMTALMLGMKPDELDIETPNGTRWDIPDDILARVKDELIKAKPNFKAFVLHTPDHARILANEEAWLSFGASLNLGINAVRAGSKNIKSTFPSQGTIGWVDGHMIVKGAKHREGAVRWIDHAYSAPNVVISMTQKWYPYINKVALDMIVDMGFEEEINALQSYKAGEWSAQYSQFKPLARPAAFNDLWAEFLAA